MLDDLHALSGLVSHSCSLGFLRLQLKVGRLPCAQRPLTLLLAEALCPELIRGRVSPRGPVGARSPEISSLAGTRQGCLCPLPLLPPALAPFSSYLRRMIYIHVLEENRNLSSPRSGGGKSKSRDRQGGAPHAGSRGSFLVSSSSWGRWSVLGLWMHLSSLCPWPCGFCVRLL